MEDVKLLEYLRQWFKKNGLVLLGLFLIAIFFWVAYKIIIALFSWFSGLEDNAGAAIIAASVVALFSIISLIISKNFEQKREFQQEHNRNKIPIYEEFILFSSKVQFAKTIGKQPPTEKEVMEFMADFTPKFIIWGNAQVIKSFCAFRDYASQKDPSVNILFLYEDILMAIRKDLGHSDRSLKKGDLLRLFINDLDKSLLSKQSPPVQEK